MKTIKLSRKVQIILATIFVIIVGAIIVGSLSNGEILAVKSLEEVECEQGHSGGLLFKRDVNGKWGVYCEQCGAIIAGEELSDDEILEVIRSEEIECEQGHSGLLVKDDGNKKHGIYCEQCETFISGYEDCIPKSIWEHKQDTNLHQKLCKICDGVCEEEACYDNNGDGICDADCGNTSMHSKSSTVKEYTKITETTHTPVYTCVQEGCTETYEGTEEPHNYVDGQCICGQTEQQESTIEITSEKYELDETYISKVQTETTVSGLKASIETNATEVNIYNRNNELISDTDKIGTGMKVELKNEEQTKTFTIIVKGDTDGDGTAEMIDITTINKYRLNKNTLDEAYLKAGDVTGDGKVDFYDIIKINKFRLHKITEL